MNKEMGPNLSAEYGHGIGRVDFRPTEFSFAALREIARLQINSTDHPIIEFTYKHGQIKTMGGDDFTEARGLTGNELKRFTTGLAHQMANAEKISIMREVKEAAHHLHLSNDPISEFVRGLKELDAI